MKNREKLKGGDRVWCEMQYYMRKSQRGRERKKGISLQCRGKGDKSVSVKILKIRFSLL